MWLDATGSLSWGAFAAALGVCLCSGFLVYALGENDWRWTPDVTLAWIWVVAHGFVCGAGVFIATKESLLLGSIGVALLCGGLFVPFLPLVLR
ncbi:MAG: hypothetical protein HYS13_20725 [Planctomycetia bacterium]|nr:hypothetical protein [Planctomycetia bacterium]